MSRPVPDPWIPTMSDDGGVVTPKHKKTPRRTWHAFSPHKVKSPESEIPTLQITHFTKKQIVCFEVVKIGKTRKRPLRLYNPHDYPQTVELERISPKKGFSLEDKMWEVPPNSELVIPICWTPPDEGTFRDLMTLLCEDAFRLQVILLGTAENPAKKVPGRRSTFLVKKSKPQRLKNPQMMRKKRVPGKENAGPVPERSPDSQIPDKGVTKAAKDVLQVTPAYGKKVHKSPGAIFNEQTTSAALTELTNAAEPIQNVPPQKPVRETLVVCPGMSPMLKTRKGDALTKRKVPKKKSERASRQITREDKVTVEVFDEPTTMRALIELTNAMEPIQNVPSQNPSRETLLVCPGMSPLLRSKKRDTTSKREASKRDKTARRVLNKIAVKAEVNSHPECPATSGKHQQERVVLKGTEVKVHQSRSADLGSSMAMVSRQTEGDSLPSPTPDSDQTDASRVLKRTEVKAHSSPALTGEGIDPLHISKKVLFTEEDNDLLDAETYPPEESTTLDRNHGPKHGSTSSSSNPLDDADCRERVGEESPVIMVSESLGESMTDSTDDLGSEQYPNESTIEDSLDDEDVAAPSRQSRESGAPAPSVPRFRAVSSEAESCISPHTCSASSPDMSVMEDSLEERAGEPNQGVESERTQLSGDLDNLKSSSTVDVLEEGVECSQSIMGHQNDPGNPGSNSFNLGPEEDRLGILESGNRKMIMDSEQTSDGGGKISLDSLDGQDSSCQEKENDHSTDFTAGDGLVGSPEVGGDPNEESGEDDRDMGAEATLETSVHQKIETNVPGETREVGLEENIVNLLSKDWQPVKLVIQEITSRELVNTSDGCDGTGSGKEEDLMDAESVQPLSSCVIPSSTSEEVKVSVTLLTEDAADEVMVEESKPECQGLVFIPLDEKPKKRSMIELDSDKPLKKLRTTATDTREMTAGQTTKRSKGSLSLNRTVALRRASATNTAAPAKVRAKPKVKRVVKGVPMSKLHLLRPAKTALPRHPMPFAAKNMFYDERWMDKQERGFVQWLNYILTPEGEESVRNPTIKGKKIEASMLALPTSSVKIEPAPTKEVLSMRAYTARRRLNRLRRCACLLFQSEPVVRVIQKVEAQVENRGLTVRTDRKIHADLGMKQNILMMILSYNPLWLRIGLETIFGEILPIDDNSDVIGLSRFIVTRLLGNPDIAQQFAHPTVPALFGPGYDGALAKFTLKKFLLLVFFLDKAKLTRLIDHDPCLFCKDAQFKSSRDLLLDFSRLYLKGEGDITRHLNYIGYSVSHIQKALDEYDFAVINLAKDLRDGIRLVRVTELLMQNWLLSHELRCPAISRLQKVHNVQVALEALSPSTNLADDDITAKAIVDGHREKTLKLLWNIIFSFKVETMLDEAQLKDETAFLWKNLQLKRNLDAVKMLAVRRNIDRTDTGDDVYTIKSPKLDLLLKWCRAVCAYHDIPIDNFTVSFCDGRAFCYMVHHYHPELIETSSIVDETTQTEARDEGPAPSGLDDSLDRSWSPTEFSQGSLSQGASFEQLKKNEQANFKTLYGAMKSLGGVPFMIKASDMSGTIPDEKVVITYVSYVCARLLDLCKETRAVRTIKLAWRRYKLEKMMKKQKEQYDAALIIQRWLRGCLKKRLLERQTVAVVCLQTAVRGWLASRELATLQQQELQQRRAAAATIIQAHVRCWQAQRKFKAQIAAVLRLQSLVRGWMARRSLEGLRRAVRTVEAHYHAHRIGAWAREEYQRTRKAIVILQAICRGKQARKLLHQMKAARTIQASWRGYRTRAQYYATRRAVMVIQSAVRMHLQRRIYLRQRSAATGIQEWYRAALDGRQVREAYMTQRNSAVIIQSHFRGFQARREFAHQRSRCIVIQSLLRGFIARRRFNHLKSAAVLVQRRYRAKLLGDVESCRYKSMKLSAVTLQAALRGWLARRELAQRQAAACLIQSWFRGRMERRRYLRMRDACVTIQSHIRSHHLRKRFLAMRGAALTIQRIYRGQQTRKEVKRIRSAIKIQATYRMLCARRAYRVTVSNLVTCQAHVKGFIARRRYSRVLLAARVIQGFYRGYQQMKSAKEELCLVRDASLVIQSAYRGYMARCNYQREVQSIVRCQAVVRGFLGRQRYRSILQATLVLQQHIRAFLKMKTAQREFYEIRNACVAIQSVYRGYRARREFHRRMQSVVMCQKLVRGYIARRRYQSLLQATMVVQRYIRAYLRMKSAQREFTEVRSACVAIQSVYRGYRARGEFHRQVQSVVTCQKLVRGFLARRDYQRRRNAALIIQRYHQAHLAMRKQRREYQRLRAACIVLQAASRGYCCRRRYAAAKVAAVTIQSQWRMVMAHRQYCRKRAASMAVQRRLREILLGRHQRDNYLKMRQAAIILQSAYRGYQSREYVKYLRKIVLCQSAVRMFIARLRYQKDLKTIINLQARVRSCTVRRRYLALREAATLLQRRWRAVLIGREEHLSYHVKRGGIIVIQASVRSWLARREFLKMRDSAVLIQTAYRRHAAKVEYQNQRNAAIKLQTYVRAFITGRGVRDEFVGKRASAIVIQSWWRMAHKRREFMELRSAVIMVQKLHRRRVAVRTYREQINAILTLQRYVRAYLESRAVRREFLRCRSATVCIQAWWCMTRDRRDYERKRMSAIKIQSAFRRQRAMKAYKVQRRAIISLQRIVRAYNVGKAIREEYLMTRSSAVLVQAWWRMILQRQRYKRLRAGVILIQAQLRMVLAWRRYQHDRSAIVTIQQRWRAKQLMLEESRKYAETRKAIITLQALVRGRRSRKLVALAQKSAVVIQAQWKGYMQRYRYITKQNAALVLQRRYKALVLMKAERDHYSNLKAATVVIQSFARGLRDRRLAQRHRAARLIQATYRMYQERKHYHKLRSSAVIIQAIYRGHACRQSYLQILSAVCTIQSRLRAYQEGRSVRERLDHERQAAVVIQSRYRCFTARRGYKAKLDAAVQIQSFYRCYKGRSNYQRMRAAVVLLQEHWRATSSMRAQFLQYHVTRGAVITIQSVVRAYLLRRDFLQRRAAVVTLQKTWRGYQCREEFAAMKAAVTCVQRCWRAKRRVREIQTAYQATRNKIVQIQAMWRAHLARKRFLEIRSASMKLQAFARGHRCRKEYLQMRAAASVIQERWHARTLARECRHAYVVRRNGIVLIQSLIRMHKCREEFLKRRYTAVVLQALARGVAQRRVFLKEKKAAVVLQRRWRAQQMAKEAKIAYLDDRTRLILVQSLFRGRKCRQDLLRKERAAVLIQSCIRGYLSRQEYGKVKRAVVILQTRWHARQLARETQRMYLEERRRVILIQGLLRGMRCRKEFLRKRGAAILIQACVRRYLSQQKYKNAKNAAIILQTRWRARQMAKNTQVAYLEERKKVILIQSMFRARKCRQEFLCKRTAVILIQSRLRGHLSRQSYVNLKSAAAVLQTRWRAKQMGPLRRKQFLSMKSSAIAIQSMYRGYTCRQHFLQVRRAVLLIQAHARGSRCVTQYRRMKGAAVVIQHWYRTVLLNRRMMKEFELVSGAALRIQSLWRGHVARRRAERLRWEKATAEQREQAALKIQCWARCRLQRARYLELREGTLLAQRLYRAHLRRRIAAALVIQNYARMWLARKQVRDRNRAATTIQAIWRGRAVRKSGKSKKIARARARCMKATRAATEDKKLCNRTTSALDFLLGYKYLDQVLEAVSSLEVATRLSSHCCEQLVAGQAVPVLFCLIGNCNRSLPCMEVIKHTVATLINLAKYTITAPSVLERTESVTSLLDLMMIYRETNPAIATKTAVLLTILGQHEDIKQVILATPKVDEKLRSLRYLHERKQKLKTQQRIVKSRTKGLGLTPSATPSKRARLRRQFQPDWVLGHDKRPEPCEPLEAIKCLNEVLSVQ